MISFGVAVGAGPVAPNVARHGHASLSRLLLIVAKLSDKDPLTPTPLPQGGEGRVRLSLRPSLPRGRGEGAIEPTSLAPWGERVARSAG